VTPDTTESAKRLTNCPCCNYSLEGLPAEYLCPECGVAYDPTVVVVELQKVRRGPWLWIGSLCFGLFLWARMTYRTLDLENIVFTLIMVAPFLAQLWRSFVSAGTAGRFLMSRSGLLLIRANGSRDHVLWSQVATVKQSFWNGALYILDSNRRVALRCSYREFEEGSRRVRKCVHEIERRRTACETGKA
jgi:hypothetical protein